MARLSREFYLGDTVDIARRLLGTYLVRQLGQTVLVGRITDGATRPVTLTAITKHPAMLPCFSAPGTPIST